MAQQFVFVKPSEDKRRKESMRFVLFARIVVAARELSCCGENAKFQLPSFIKKKYVKGS